MTLVVICFECKFVTSVAGYFLVKRTTPNLECKVIIKCHALNLTGRLKTSVGVHVTVSDTRGRR